MTTMKLDSVSRLNFLEKSRKDLSIVGLEMKDGRIYDTLAQRNAGSRVHLKLFRDQILASIRQLEYFYQLDPKSNTFFGMKKLAIESLCRTYSFGLRENSLMSREEDNRLILSLLRNILEPFGDTNDFFVEYDKTALASSNSQLWALSDYSLDLLRFLYDNHWKKLDIVFALNIEMRLMNLSEITLKAHQDGLSFPGTSKRLANAIYILYKIFCLDIPVLSFSSTFFYKTLFPLACEFAAKEYPMTIVDPIGHYKLFESSGTLKEPDVMLTEWEKRHGTAPKRDGSEGFPQNSLDATIKSRDLPPNHASIESFIFKFGSKSDNDQSELIKFLQRKILEKDEDSIKKENGALDDNENSRLPLMNKIVALTILGRLNYHFKPEELPSFIKVLVLPNLKEDPLLMKLCKFQLFRLFTVEDLEWKQKIVDSFLVEFIKLHTLTSDHSQHKLLIMFIAVASSCLFRTPESIIRPLFYPYFVDMSHRSQMELVDTIISLFYNYKIVDPLILIRTIMNKNHNDESFTKECELKLTKVIDSITGLLMLMLPGIKKNEARTKQALRLFDHLLSLTINNTLPLPGETVEKLLKIVETCLIHDLISVTGWDLYSYQLRMSSCVKCALKFPPDEQTQSTALYVFDRLLDGLISRRQSVKRVDVTKLSTAAWILGNLAWYSVALPTNNGSTPAVRQMLFDPLTSTIRIQRIHEICSTDLKEVDLTSSWLLSTLMSWPPSSAATVGSTTAPNNTSLYWLRQYLIELAITRLDICEEKEKKKDSQQLRNSLIDTVMIHDDIDQQMFKTRDNLLFAIMAAFNSSPKLLESYLEHAKGETASGDSHLRLYVKLWLDAITREDKFWLQEMREDTFISKSYMHISYQTLMNIHKARSEDKLMFSIKGLTNQLNSARRIVLNWLRDSLRKAIISNSPFSFYYTNTMTQLENIGNIK